jgi:hypothetical protein
MVLWMVGRVIADPSIGLPSLCGVVPQVSILVMSISLLFMDDAWKKEELSFMHNWRSHAIVDIQNPMHKIRGGGALSFDGLSSCYS